MNDTVAPVSALLNVRRQLANRAVRRAIEEVGRKRATQDEIVGRGEQTSPVVAAASLMSLIVKRSWSLERLVAAASSA